MFSKIYNMNDLAKFLGIQYEDLHKVLFSRDNYIEYEIPKKHGGTRKISAPKKILKRIQGVLKIKLESVYIPKNCVNGFVTNKSIYTNAYRHEASEYLLNIDLSDFFPSINFNRIKSLLQNPPFNANSNTSIMLANLLTNSNGLPQGASTSPILSNMICRRMDNRLFKYCEKYNGIYTRYADDISLSWNCVNNIGYFYDEKNKVLNKILTLIIEEEGFEINHKKTYYSSKNGHKEVTGVIVNKYVNVPKDYFYRLRSIINDVYKNGFDIAYRHHCEKMKIKYEPEGTNQFVRKLMGMMSYYKMIVNNEVFSRKRYIKIAEKLNEKLRYNFCVINYDISSLKNDAVFIFSKKTSSDEFGYGTIFRYKKYLITCKHCLMSDVEFEEFRSKNSEEVSNYLSIYEYYYSKNEIEKKQLNKVYISSKYDLAIFYDDDYAGKVSFNTIKCDTEVGDEILVMGFPDYKWLDECSLLSGKITGQRVIASGGVGSEKNDYYTTDASIITGNSGGPVINNEGIVLGMATWGVDSHDAVYASVKNGVLKGRYIQEEIEYIESVNWFGEKRI